MRYIYKNVFTEVENFGSQMDYVDNCFLLVAEPEHSLPYRHTSEFTQSFRFLAQDDETIPHMMGYFL